MQRKRQKDYEECGERDRRITESVEKETERLREEERKTEGLKDKKKGKSYMLRGVRQGQRAQGNMKLWEGQEEVEQEREYKRGKIITEKF